MGWYIAAPTAEHCWFALRPGLKRRWEPSGWLSSGDDDFCPFPKSQMDRQADGSVVHAPSISTLAAEKKIAKYGTPQLARLRVTERWRPALALPALIHRDHRWVGPRRLSGPAAQRPSGHVRRALHSRRRRGRGQQWHSRLSLSLSLRPRSRPHMQLCRARLFICLRPPR
jgi:hypothetical protein